MLSTKFHTPVMLREVLGYLDLKPGDTIVDATLGTAGHSQEILKRILPGGGLIGIDRDEDSLAVARSRLSEFGPACKFIHGNFVDLDTLLAGLKVEKVEGILFDLGISSFQLQDAARGFSFQNEGPLDMRMDKNSYILAYDLINNLNEEELSTLLWNFGEERWHSRIARFLVKERQRQPIATTVELANIVFKSIPSRYHNRHFRIHPATRTFQAVRIAVNREIEILEAAISKAVAALNKGARICVISFHSLEDRAIKFTFRKAEAAGLIDILTPKPLTPTQSEVSVNPASRSSKLRAAERI
jgi:16S rRNA (cytosine1402-N4)-methyltransferase